MTRKVEPKLSQDSIFIKEVVPWFAHNMNHNVLEVRYTNGQKDVFTTNSNNPNHFGTHEFETLEDMKQFQSTL